MLISTTAVTLLPLTCTFFFFELIPRYFLLPHLDAFPSPPSMLIKGYLCYSIINFILVI